MEQETFDMLKSDSISSNLRVMAAIYSLSRHFAGAKSNI